MQIGTEMLRRAALHFRECSAVGDYGGKEHVSPQYASNSETTCCSTESLSARLAYSIVVAKEGLNTYCVMGILDETKPRSHLLFLHQARV